MEKADFTQKESGFLVHFFHIVHDVHGAPLPITCKDGMPHDTIQDMQTNPQPFGPMPTPNRWQIFRTFLLLGCSAFGGPAIIVHLREEIMRRRGWVRVEAFDDGIGLCQAIPGATGMQMAGYLGLRIGGIRGALAAFVGFGLPAFLLMLALSAVYSRTCDLPSILAVFNGLQAVVVALVAHAAWSFGREFVKYWQDALLAVIVAIYLGLGGVPYIAIPIAALAGLGIYRRMGTEESPRSPAPYTQRDRAWKAAVLVVSVAAAGMAVLFCMDRPLFNLAFTMMRIDLFAFGGGYAALPIMLHEMVDARQWMDTRTFMDGIALGQITPGPIIITATFVGYMREGLAGACVATAGIFLPSFLVLLALAPDFHRLRRHSQVRRVLRGAVASFVGLLLATTAILGTEVSWNPSLAAVGTAAFIALRMRAEVPWVVLGGACAAWLLQQV